MFVVEMQPSDLGFAAECTASEGWASETPAEIEGLFLHDPSGCLIAEADGKRMGICIATNYGESAFVGELIVIKEMRRLGIGRRLIEHAIRYLSNRGAKNVFLDGVPATIPLYERIGFRKVCRSLRFVGRIKGRSCEKSRPMEEKDLDIVLGIDRRAFGADRGYFLKRRLSLYPKLCKVLEVGDEIAGYIMGRTGRDIVSIGPWVIQQSVVNPEKMLENIALEAGTLDLRLGVLETNTAAVETVRSLGFKPLQNPPWRMVLGLSGDLGSSNQCYAIGSPAKG